MSEKLDISVSELENFVQGRVWRVIVQAVVDRTNEKMGELCVLDPNACATDIARNQGFVEALSFVIDYPAILREQVEYEQKEEERKNG